MRFTNKQTSPGKLALTAQFPQMPDIGAIAGRSPELAEYKRLLDTWWFDTRTALQRILDSIVAQNTDTSAFETATNKSIADLKTLISNTGASISALQAAIDKIQNQPTTDITALKKTVEDHIAATQAHGTESPVVGQNDAESLDNKTIGLNGPGQGRFIAAMASQNISDGTAVKIPPGYSSVLAGPLNIDGLLQVEGTMCIL